MSVRDALIYELAHQPDEVAQKLLDYLHALVPEPGSRVDGRATAGYFSGYWKRHYGAFEGKEWSEPAELPAEKREEW